MEGSITWICLITSGELTMSLMINSIMVHLEQLLFTLDVIIDTFTNAKHYGNPDTFFVFYYHFTAFISLAKTIGDNLVWILTLYLSLNIKHTNRDLTSNKFKEALKNRSRFFYNLLYSNNYFAEFEKLCKLRDVIQHRHVIRAMRVVTIMGENKILIPKNPEYLISQDLRIINNPQPDTVILAENVESTIRQGLHEYLRVDDGTLNDFEEPMMYCNKHREGITAIIESCANQIVNEITRKFIAKVIGFYPRKMVAVIEVIAELKVGDWIQIERKDSSFQQEITSMEIDHQQFQRCDKGLAAIKVDQKVKNDDKIFAVRKMDEITFRNRI
jgi:hypothetical protein